MRVFEIEHEPEVTIYAGRLSGLTKIDGVHHAKIDPAGNSITVVKVDFVTGFVLDIAGNTYQRDQALGYFVKTQRT